MRTQRVAEYTEVDNLGVVGNHELVTPLTRHDETLLLNSSTLIPSQCATSPFCSLK